MHVARGDADARCACADRSMCFTTPGLSEYISGVILHQETLFQKDADGVDMVKLIADGGMLSGIKLDKGYDKAGIMGTETGPLGHPETWCKGIDDLDKRCAEAYKQGARFAKWRNVLQIDPDKGLPSDLSIDLAVTNLAQVCAAPRAPTHPPLARVCARRSPRLMVLA
jgi:fructose-bisphosphate aldolase class I